MSKELNEDEVYLLNCPACLSLLQCMKYPMKPSTAARRAGLKLSTTRDYLAAFMCLEWVRRRRDPRHKQAFLYLLSERGEDVRQRYA